MSGRSVTREPDLLIEHLVLVHMPGTVIAHLDREVLRWGVFCCYVQKRLDRAGEDFQEKLTDYFNHRKRL